MENNSQDFSKDLELLQNVAIEAGRIALKYYKSDNEVWMKPGDSPVSQADFAVNDYLQKHLQGERANYGWISEETEDNDKRLDQNRVFIVDPIDGTRGFINGLDQWCISIAIVENDRPVAAVLECPALNESYSAAVNSSSSLNGDVLIGAQASNITKVTGSRKINDLINADSDGHVHATEFVPSLAYRIAMVANGSIDVAFARPGAHEWDLAAADLILENTGGCLIDKNGRPLKYNRRKLHQGSLIACSKDLTNPAIKLAKSAGILH